MQATQTTSSQYIAFDQPFNLALIVLVMLICAAIMLWTLYRERRVLGSKTTTLFALLRALAIATVLWMLLAPTSVIEESTSTKKAVAIVTDISASMTTVDPPGTADELRWAISNQDNVGDEIIRRRIAAADRAVAALGLAQRELNGAISDLEKHGSQSLVTEHLGLASQAIDRSRTYLQDIQDDADPSIEPMVRRLFGLLESPEIDSLAELTVELQRDRTPAESGWRESLPDLVGRTATARRVFQEIADTTIADHGDATRSADVAVKQFLSRPRSERVASLLNRLTILDSVSEKADLRWSSFDESTQDLSDKDATTQFLGALADREDLSNQTDLAAALQHVDRMRQDQPVAATFIFTDVAHNHAGDRDPTELAAKMDGAPVYIVPIGNQARRRDIDLVSISAPSVAMRNDDVVIEAQMEVYQCLGETCVVQLLRDGEVVDFRNVQIDSDSATRRVRFEERVSETGTASFQIAVQPLDGEMTTENNFDEVEINVTRSDIKVLLADELPRWEYRYLAQLFRRDPKVELDELLFRPRLIATGRREDGRTFPVNVDGWDQYDVVILGDLPTEHFPVAAQESLIQYLRKRGGTVILIAGDQAMPQAFVDHPLEEVIPVRPIETDDPRNGYAFHVTDDGRSHIALMIGETEQSTRDAWEFVNRFSPLYRVSRWRTPLATARSLIAAVPRAADGQTATDAADQSTFLCWQPVGRGRLVYLSGPDTYRLRFLRGDRLHYRFWGQLMRWAIAADLSAGNQLVRIHTNKTLYETDETVSIEVELLDSDGGPVVVGSDESGDLQVHLVNGENEQHLPLVADPDRPGHYRAEVNSIAPGIYQAQPSGEVVNRLMNSNDADSAATDEVVATFTVQADLPTELIDTRSNRVLAGQVSELSGGQVLPPSAVEEVLELTNLDPIVTRRVERQPLWLRWRYLWLTFACLQTEWIIRKWRGLS